MNKTVLPKSQVPHDFAEQVQAHIAHLNAHRFTEGHPAPAASALVEQVIARVQHPRSMNKPDDFVANYEIHDDTPPVKELSLREKKDKLLLEVGIKEKSRLDALLPPGKRRMNEIQITTIWAKNTGEKDFRHTPEDEEFMAAYSNRHAAMDNLHRAVAFIQSEIEDLTESDIDSWVMPAI